MEWIIKNLLSISFDYRNRYFARKICRIEAAEHPDIVICSTFSNSGLRAAARLAESKGIPFIADLRDITEQSKNSEYERLASDKNNTLTRLIINTFRKVNIRRRNKELRKADAITAVSPWTTKFLSQFNPNAHLIYNGYDSAVFKFEERRSPKFQIVYMGKWYPKMQDPTPLFEALERIKTERPDIYPDIAMTWYTADDCIGRLKTKAAEYGIGDCMDYNSYVPFAEVPALLHRSSIILILSDESSPHVLPTKLFEAIGVGKPALCVKCIPGALADTICNANAGLATTDAAEVMPFIIRRHNEWKTNGFTRQPTANSGFYSRNHQANILAQLVYGLTNNTTL